ncbi:MAG: family 20 glycosylhydrolase [Bacteroidales bacterium]|nr:family 20 glycosylhydrolase [Bacteroidales bacterium]
MKKIICLTCLYLLFLMNTSMYAQKEMKSDPTPVESWGNIYVMPFPKEIKAGSGKLRINSHFSINLSGAENDKVLEDATNRFLSKLKSRALIYPEQKLITLNNRNANTTLVIDVKTKSVISIGIDESYQLIVDSTKVTLNANSTIGALRGMETLLQLVSADAEGYYIPEVKINDSPRFKWRGMMVDVARHFIPIEILKRNIDAMSVVKLNVLHLHLSDDEGFRVESKIFPKLQEFGSNGQFYTQDQLKDLVNYAEARGIMIYPEFDLPGHSTSWLAGYPEFASAPGPYKPGHRFIIKPGTNPAEAAKIIMQSATPTLDPTKEAVYQFLDKFVAEMTSVFSSPYFHIGADENNGIAWQNNAQIAQFMKTKGLNDVSELQAYFINRMHTIIIKHNRKMVGWEELYNSTLPKDVIVQVWGAMGDKHASPPEIAEKGNQVLISKGFYLDYFYPAYIHYLNPNIPSTTNSNLLGGEAALWAELVDENSFEGRAWPRTAVIAERLWSPENLKDIDNMYARLFVLSDRLEEGGLNHRLNAKRMLSRLSNGQNIEDPLLILQTLAPSRGFGRLMTQFSAAEETKYQSVPLVDLPDLASTDSKEAWQFRKWVERYLVTKDTTLKTEITKQLRKWSAAAFQILSLVKTAPNLAEFAIYSERVQQATDLGLQVLGKSHDKYDNSAMVQTLKGLKKQGDRLEILILPEIEALITGILSPLPMSFSPF